MINPEWSRWIFASLSKHFAAAVDTYPFFIEGTHRPTPQAPVLVEFRQTGPDYRLRSPKEYFLRLTVNLLYKVSMSEQNFHLKYSLAGEISAAFAKGIPLFTLGDDPEQFGCLTLQSGPRVLHYGQIEKDISVEQGTVEGTYITYLESP